MNYRILLLCLLCWAQEAVAQNKIAPADMRLKPYRMTGQDNPLRKNLAFADYKTNSIRRTLGSFFYYQAPSLANAMLATGDIPVYEKNRLRAKDVFRFDLDKNGQPVASTECRAIFRKNETFYLLHKQDSTFFGARNTDLLDARIRLTADTSQVWHMLASNLNGSKDEDQKGIIRNGGEEIRFVKTTMLLRDKPVSDNSPVSLLASIDMVYAFTYNDEVVAAVSFKEADRRFWLREGLDQPLADVIASAASLLTIRRDLYR
ncbi:hypothetical protein GZH53_01330 [Flavihumibacter sp. R14]|nr:hypothetical protein [Flavihumibacter soli]